MLMVVFFCLFVCICLYDQTFELQQFLIKYLKIPLCLAALSYCDFKKSIHPKFVEHYKEFRMFLLLILIICLENIYDHKQLLH